MIIELSELSLNEPKTFTINGTEDWLRSFYLEFQHVNEKTAAQQGREHLEAELTLERFTETRVKISGWLRYCPLVDCSRCAHGIPWKLSEPIDLWLEWLPQNFPDLIDLQSEQLDECFLAGSAFNLLEFFRESVSLALPLRTTPPETADQHCSLCGLEMQASCVFSTDKYDIAPLPFGTHRPFTTLLQPHAQTKSD